MRTQDEFVAARQPRLDRARAAARDGKGFRKLPPTSIARAAAIYRAVSSDLMRAEAAGYSPDVIALLDGLAARAHNTLYSAPPTGCARCWSCVAVDFPHALRRHSRFFALAVALFVLPGVLGFVGALRSRDFALSILSPDGVEQMEKAYAEGFGKGREAGVDTAMTGFYVYNNVGIAFRCFATGVLFGPGQHVLPGLQRPHHRGGGGAGHRRGPRAQPADVHLHARRVRADGHRHLRDRRDGDGLRAGRDGRTHPVRVSLRAQARDIADLVMGAALMLLVAAAIEGFWSPSSVRPPVKWGAAVGA